MRADYAHAILTIDLGAVVSNWRFLQTKHPSGAVGAVVKGDAYGVGAAPVAAALAAAGCRHFFVGTPDEALALRDTVPNAMVIALGGLFGGAERDFAAHDIVPALGSLAEIHVWSSLARELGRKLPALIHLDTGMSRLGLDAAEADVLAGDHSRLAGIDLRYLMSHLVTAEVPDDPLNILQRNRFAAFRRRLPPAPASLANSSGIFLGEAFGFDLARPGCALYGINPTPDRSNPMQPVVGLTARVLSVRRVPQGATVGYNATWSAARATRIATIGIGYADGWHRSHSNTGAAFFDGNPIPLVGRVSMDLTTFDVTDHPAVKPGDWLELLGPRCCVDEAARAAGTIGYEVLTALGRRLQRIYSPA